MGGFFYKLGRSVGPQVRKANWLFRSLTGTEAESIRAEQAVGRDLAQAFLDQVEVNRDPELAQWIGDLGNQLVVCVKNRQWPFHFYVIQSIEFNAFALPGGFIFLTAGLLELCQWDRSELAFVLGHEMGHVLHRHAIDRVMASSVITATVGRILPGGGLLRAPVTSLVSTLLHQGYSQDQEFEADRMGVRLLRGAGLETQAAIRLLTRLQSQTGDASILGSYFSSHPPLDVRIDHVARLIAT
jgi:predicted Zn-dependent protease